MAKDDYFVIVHYVLDYLYDCLKNDEVVNRSKLDYDFVGISCNYWCYIMKYLLDKGYVTGFETITVEQTIRIGFLKEIQITPEGIEYLFSNAMIQEAKQLTRK